MQLLYPSVFLLACASTFACSGNDPSDPNNHADSDAPSDSDDSGPCTQGATRCNQTELALQSEQCDATGAWVRIEACPYVCVDGACAGECSPHSTACCQDVMLNGNPTQQCGPFFSTCVGGPGCGDGHPTRVYLRGCSDQGTFEVLNDCITASWLSDAGTEAETVNNQCGVCESTGQLECQNGQTGTCGSNP